MFYSDLVRIWEQIIPEMEKLKLGVARSGGSQKLDPRHPPESDARSFLVPNSFMKAIAILKVSLVKLAKGGLCYFDAHFD